MAKKDDLVIEKLTAVLDKLTELLTVLANPPTLVHGGDIKIGPGGMKPDYLNQDGDVIDAETEVPTKKAPEKKAPAKKAKKFTLEECRDKLMEFDRDGDNREMCVAFLAGFKAKNMKQVDEAVYPKFMEELQAKIDALPEASTQESGDII